MREYGIALGTAYQVYDDCLDLFGSEAAAGKSLGTDLAKGKLTLPVLQFWQRADAGEKARMRGTGARIGSRGFLAPVTELLSGTRRWANRWKSSTNTSARRGRR